MGAIDSRDITEYRHVEIKGDAIRGGEKVARMKRYWPLISFRLCVAESRPIPVRQFEFDFDFCILSPQSKAELLADL